MVGHSPSLRSAFEILERAAKTDVTVLITGETGTGKESAAELLHRRSPRAAGPFIVLDCGSIPPALLESELFGHEKGSFTNAVASRAGCFELAAGGTVFLDEIGELAPDLQPKLLRVLERKQVKRVGAGRYEEVDVRVVAATSRNLLAEVKGGQFRRDLYYRLAVVHVDLPPLRERLEDLPCLIDHFLQDLAASARPEAALLRSPAVQAELAQQRWPGNVRELRNYLERYLTLGPSSLASERHEPTDDLSDIDTQRPLKVARELLLRRFETRYLKDILARHRSIADAAHAAGIDRVTFYRMLARNGLRQA
jgi:DNA-binding NtrC family response regulator